jgi:hypothetical protein
MTPEPAARFYIWANKHHRQTGYQWSEHWTRGRRFEGTFAECQAEIVKEYLVEALLKPIPT